jgi:hypothetical protein
LTARRRDIDITRRSRPDDRQRMPGSGIPAPLGSGTNQPSVDAGTLALAPMPAPTATTGAPPPSASSPAVTPVVANATPAQVDDHGRVVALALRSAS